MPKRGYGDDVGSTSVKKTKTGGGYAKGLANKIKSSKTGNGYAKGMVGKAKAEENDRERQSLKKGDAFWEVCSFSPSLGPGFPPPASRPPSSLGRAWSMALKS